MVLTRFGMLPEVLFYVIHINTYLLYVVGPPAILISVFAGGFRRIFAHKAAWLWLGFFLWMILATPFSTWRGSSVNRVMDYSRFAFPMLFVTGGLIASWKDVVSMMKILAGSLVINEITVRLFGKLDDGGRLTLDASGSIGNSNDLEAHFALLLPLSLFVLMDGTANKFIRFLMVLVAGYGCYVIFSTGSRGGVLAMIAMFLFTLVRARSSQKTIAVALAAAAILIIPMVLPGSAVSRMMSLFGASEHEEAAESKNSRAYLFRQSLVYSIQFPIFGVGPDQFPNYEGTHGSVMGGHGEFHATHCAFTEVSSECGIMAAVFFIGGIVTAFASVSKVNTRAKKEGHPDIANASFCFLLAMVGYVVSITFLANAYTYYLPAFIGLAIALQREANRYMDANRPGMAVAAAPSVAFHPLLRAGGMALPARPR